MDDLLQACALLARDEPDLAPDLRIVGAGEAMEGLKALASVTYPRARFLGALYGEALADQFARADLFVLPGQVGLGVQEAMSYGLPVIVGEGDHTQHDLVSPQNGWLIPFADAAALAVAMREALSDVPRLRAMGAASFDVVDQAVNIESLVDSFVHAIESTRRSFAR